MDKDVWEEAVRKDANKEGVRSHDRYKRGVCSEKGKGVPIVERGERRSMRVHSRTTEERIHQTLKVASNSTGVFRREERWQEENDTGLQIFK